MCASGLYYYWYRANNQEKRMYCVAYDLTLIQYKTGEHYEFILQYFFSRWFTMKKFGLLIILLSFFSLLNAQTILNEDFNFTGNLTANGWVAHSEAGIAPINTTTGLTYSLYPGSGIGNAALLDSVGEDVNHSFTTQTSGIIYYSFLVNVTSRIAGYFIHLGATTNVARVFIKPSVPVDKINFGISNTGTATYAATPTDFDLLTTYLVVVKYDVSATGAASLWVFSSGVPISEIAAGTPEVTTAGSGQESIVGIYLRQYSATQNITVDGIRVANSWTEASLPVELSSFSASVIGSTVKLNWRLLQKLIITDLK